MEPDKKFKGRTGEITIGDNVFIGAHSTILYDVHIGNNVIIGAGSIVTRIYRMGL
jgi:acetyltransferase-like isoleucine patch superfamily enzyme